MFVKAGLDHVPHGAFESGFWPADRAFLTVERAGKTKHTQREGT